MRVQTRSASGFYEAIRVLLAVAGAAAALSAVPGCNTTEGVGEDIEAAGDAIDDAAEDKK